MFVKERRLYFSLHLYLTAYHLYFHITKMVGKRWLFRCIRILRKIYTNTVSIYIASGVKLGSSGGMHPWGNFWEQLPWRKTLEARRENNYNNSTQTSFQFEPCPTQSLWQTSLWLASSPRRKEIEGDYVCEGDYVQPVLTKFGEQRVNSIRHFNVAYCMFLS